MTDTTSVPLASNMGPHEAPADPTPAELRSSHRRVGTLTGPLVNWMLFDHGRQYGTVTIPYALAAELVMADVYKGESGKGQQRDIVDAHVKNLDKANRAGTFTPTVASASLSPRHRERLELDEKAKTFSIEVDSADPLLSVDGNHRFETLRTEATALSEALDKAKDEEQAEKLRRWLEQVMTLPITLVIYFDGDPAVDFINLQKGKRVDASHLKSLVLRAGLDKDPSAKLTHETARMLHRDPRSPFNKRIRFDSRGDNPLPISTLTASGASDLATSLVGLARIGKPHKKDAAFLAQAVSDAFQALVAVSKDQPEGEGLLGGVGADADGWTVVNKKVLTPIGDEGTKGSSTMLTGVGLCLAYRLLALNKERAGADDLKKLVNAAEHALNRPVAGNLSGPAKRMLIGEFARELLADLPGDRHQGVPVDLLRLLSCSAFGVTRLPKPVKPPKPAKPPKAAKPKKSVQAAANCEAAGYTGVESATTPSTSA